MVEIARVFGEVREDKVVSRWSYGITGGEQNCPSAEDDKGEPSRKGDWQFVAVDYAFRLLAVLRAIQYRSAGNHIA